MIIETSALNFEWDYETEIVVVGFGGAGAAAAIESCDNGAEVLIVEKASVAGGSTASEKTARDPLRLLHRLRYQF